MVCGSSAARTVCDLQHRQLYTRDDIRKYDESMPRSALRSLDDPYALSLKTSLFVESEPPSSHPAQWTVHAEI